MRFKIDENLPEEIAEILRSAGYDTQTVPDEGLVDASDDDILEACRNEARVLVTLDLDFADLRAYPLGDHSGLIVLRVGSQDKVHLLNVIARLVPLLSQEPVEKHLWIVEETRVRIRGEDNR